MMFFFKLNTKRIHMINSKITIYNTNEQRLNEIYEHEIDKIFYKKD